jgi:hypothetical protein
MKTTLRVSPDIQNGFLTCTLRTAVLLVPLQSIFHAGFVSYPVFSPPSILPWLPVTLVVAVNTHNQHPDDPALASPFCTTHIIHSPLFLPPAPTLDFLSCWSVSYCHRVLCTLLFFCLKCSSAQDDYRWFLMSSNHHFWTWQCCKSDIHLVETTLQILIFSLSLAWYS